MTAKFTARAPAKINLTLHVTGQRDDGYHLLDSLVVFAEDCADALSFTPDERLSIAVTGPFADGIPTDDRNLIWKAAQAAGWTGTIHLEKNLPHGGGLGGGSSDAGAALRAFGHPDQTAALSLGADVPVCLLGRAARMTGIGERVAPAALPDGLWAVLVNPGIPLPTPHVFARVTRKTNPPMTPAPATTDLAGWLDWLRSQRNDLEAAAIQLNPSIQDVLSAIKATDHIELARMSGSGSTCFGLYTDKTHAEAACATLRRGRPDWWCELTAIR